MKTLVIVSHPYPDQSRAIKALQQTAESLPDVTVRNLESLYGADTQGFDIAAEQQAHDAADRIVYLFPIHWFNLTPMLKSYLNQIWTYGWAFGPDGKALQGKEMLVVATAGATGHTYSADGLIKSSIEEVLTPMKASAYYVGMQYSQPRDAAAENQTRNRKHSGLHARACAIAGQLRHPGGYACGAGQRRVA